MKSLVTVFFVNLALSLAVSATTKEQTALHFPINADELLKGEIHFFFEILTPKQLAVQQSEFIELDSLGLSRKKDIAIIASKHAYIIKKPAGFFDDQQLSEKKYISHIMKGHTVKKSEEATYRVTTSAGPAFKMRLFFDSDDVSTIPNAKVVRAVNAVKKFDVISKGASIIMFIEKTGVSNDGKGGVSVSSFIPLNEKKTLVVTHSLHAIDKNGLKRQSLKRSFQEEIESLRKLQDSYQEN